VIPLQKKDAKNKQLGSNGPKKEPKAIQLRRELE
jgi:hypothetical protein